MKMAVTSRRVVARLSLLVAIALPNSPLWGQESGKPDTFLTLWAGMLPIILSAPHGGRAPIPGISVRRGVGVAQFTTQRDGNTEELAEKIALRVEEELGAKPFLVIARFERKFIDANRAEHAAFEAPEARPYYLAYHRALKQACDQVRRTFGRGLLLDIHGQGAEGRTIFRGTGNGRSVSALEHLFGRAALAGNKSILGQMAAKGYAIVPPVASDERERRYAGGYTTQTYGSHRGTGMDAMQLELGTSLRARASLDRTAADLAAAVVVFARAYLPVTPPSATSQQISQP